MNEKLFRTQFNQMGIIEKQALMECLAARYDMTFLGLHTFDRWGQSCTTGIFEKDGREFVFVPGDTVTLGWERFTVGLNQESREELEYLFPWGDGLDYSMRLRWFEDMDEDENRPYDMEEPNFFGLSIAYDPYMREVVQADRFTTCGGDGGCNICGGLGPFLGFLPCSPHYKPEVQEGSEINGDYDFYRPIIRVEFDG